MTDCSPHAPLRLFILSIGVVLLIVGCSSTPPTTESPELPGRFPDHSPDEIHSLIAGVSDTLHAYTAKARVTVQSPAENRTFNAEVRHRRADSLFMRVSLFGIEGGRLLLTPDSVFFYDTRKSVLRVGPVEDVQNLFPAPVSSANFFENMIGLVAPDPQTAWAVQSDSTLYYLSDSRDRRRYTVDPSRWRVVRYEQHARNGTVVQKRRFSEFRTVEGILLPARLLFSQPEANLRAKIHYQSMTLNPSDLSFSFSVPPEVPRRPFSQGR